MTAAIVATLRIQYLSGREFIEVGSGRNLAGHLNLPGSAIRVKSQDTSVCIGQTRVVGMATDHVVRPKQFPMGTGQGPNGGDENESSD